MSKIARKPIIIPEKAKFSMNDNVIDIEGPMGKLSFTKHQNISIDQDEGSISIKSNDEEQIVIDPKFIGLDKNKKPFTIRANKAKKINSNDNLYQLEMPSGEIKDSSGNTIFLKSNKGKFDQKNQKVFLFF